MAFSHHNSSIHSNLTPVLLLGTFFNSISYFSNNLAGAYSTNILQHSIYIHYRNQLSLRSLTHIIQPTQTDSPVSSPSIIFVNNNCNWKETFTTNSATNRPNSSTCSQSKLQHSNNSTNKQLANILSCIVNILTTNQTSSPNFNSYSNVIFTSIQILPNLI